MTPQNYNPLLDSLSDYPMGRNLRRKEALLAQGRKVFDFGVGDPQDPLPQVIADTLKNNIPHVSQYPPFTGTLDLKKAFSGWAQRRLGITLNPTEQVLSSNGSKEAVFHINQIVVNPNRPVIIVPEPCYPVHLSGPLLAGAEVYSVALNQTDYIFDPQSIPPEVLSRARAVWLCYPNNPTGATLDAPRARAIYKWALKHDILILSDECYIDNFDAGSEQPVSFLNISQEKNFENVLGFFTLSKRSGMTGLRSGCIAGDKRWIALFSRYRTHAGLSTPDFIQKAAVTAWSNDEHVGQRNAVFAQRRALITDFLKKQNFHFIATSATFYIWVKVPKGFQNAEAYAQHLAEKVGIIISPGDILGDAKLCEQWFRMALVPSVDDIKQCLALWARTDGN